MIAPAVAASMVGPTLPPHLLWLSTWTFQAASKHMLGHVPLSAVTSAIVAPSRSQRPEVLHLARSA